jgi:hypothetical protein
MLFEATIATLGVAVLPVEAAASLNALIYSDIVAVRIGFYLSDQIVMNYHHW